MKFCTEIGGEGLFVLAMFFRLYGASRDVQGEGKFEGRGVQVGDSHSGVVR